MSERADAAAPRGIDPRGPRFAAGITSVLLLVAVFLSLTGLSAARLPLDDAAAFGWFAYQPLSGQAFGVFGGQPIDFAFVAGGSTWAITYASFGQRLLDPAFLLFLIIALLFLWGVLSPRTAPWGVLYRKAVAPRLAPPHELEDPRPPRFAQGVGLLVVGIGLILHLLGVPWALTIAGAMAFVAAFLNAAFGVCLGCLLHLLLQRIGLIGRARPASA
jgi:Domain of unknown function (DUF4395)